jgi:CHAD domain-containing protein
VTWPLPPVFYPLPDPAPLEDLIATMREHAPVIVTEGDAVVRTFHDTFDWRVYRNGGTVEQADGHWSWRGNDGRARSGRRPGEPPAFADDLESADLRDALAAVLSVRRLLPRVTVDKTTTVLRILDDEEKTVVRVAIETGTAILPQGRAPKPMAGRVRVLPVRGYVAEFEGARTFLEKRLGCKPDTRTDLEVAMAAVGKKPGDYSSKFKLSLKGDLEAAEAARRIHRKLLKTMIANERGTRQDIDSEFLHDFRVSIRRTRSALTQFKGVFATADLERFKTEFAWLGRVTGPVRDLDVWLIKLDGYGEALPEAIRPNLEPLKAFLRREQKTEQGKMVGALDSARYERLVQDWRHFLAHGTPKSDPPPNALRPVASVARERIRKVWRRVMKRGGKIGPGSPNEKLHELRIECKKLRYLLEFFRTLFGRDEVGALVTELKRLQDNLGDFNDYEVQQDTLRKFADRMSKDGTAPAGTLLAMGRLLLRLEEGQSEERERFEECFTRFALRETRERFERLFGPRSA